MNNKHTMKMEKVSMKCM